MRLLLITIVLLCLLVFSSGDTSDISSFDSTVWPGVPTVEILKEVKPLNIELEKAINIQNDTDICRLKKEIIVKLGKYCGVPQDRPSYIKEKNTQLPDIKLITQLWLQTIQKQMKNTIWKYCEEARQNGKTEQRLRTSNRWVRADLITADIGIGDKEEIILSARTGLDYLVSHQSSNGVFGYPYNIDRNDPIGKNNKKLLDEAMKRNITILEKGWIIDDLGTGALQFDNGETAAILLHGYEVTHENKYLDSAKKALEWSMKRPLVINWNYNSYPAWALARMYRLTNEKPYLETATKFFKYGVLPGQLDDGHWFDPHNAMSTYQSLMLRNLTEYYLALKQAKDPYADEIKKDIIAGINHLASIITTYGSNPTQRWQVLELDTISLGLMVYGDNPNWENAANIVVNDLCKYSKENPNVLLPETFAQYMLYRQVKNGKAESTEVNMGKK